MGGTWCVSFPTTGQVRWLIATQTVRQYRPDPWAEPGGEQVSSSEVSWALCPHCPALSWPLGGWEGEMWVTPLQPGEDIYSRGQKTKRTHLARMAQQQEGQSFVLQAASPVSGCSSLAREGRF